MSAHPELIGTTFQLLVWEALKTIPRGEVRTYKELAALIGHRIQCAQWPMRAAKTPIQ